MTTAQLLAHAARVERIVMRGEHANALEYELACEWSLLKQLPAGEPTMRRGVNLHFACKDFLCGIDPESEAVRTIETELAAWVIA